MSRLAKREHENRTRQNRQLARLGFTDDEAAALRRASNTLRRWFEMECGTEAGHIERDEKTGKCYRVFQQFNPYSRSTTGKNWEEIKMPTADRETGAKRRIESIISERNRRANAHRFIMSRSGVIAEENRKAALPLVSYIQTDPRGAALYVLTHEQAQGAPIDSIYTRGICIY